MDFRTGRYVTTCRLVFMLPAIILVNHSFGQGTDSNDSKRLNVSVELARADPVCGLGETQDLNYGNLEIPVSGTGTASFSIDDGSFSYQDGSGNALVYSGVQTIGKMRLTGSNVSSITPDVTKPSYLQRTGCTGYTDAAGSCRIPYLHKRAWSTSESGGIWSQNEDYQFLRGSVTVYFRFGGEISIPAGMPSGDYNGITKIIVRVICG